MPIQINEIYANLFKYFTDDSIRYLIIYGGRRSGKSVGISDILTYIAGTCPNTFIPAVRKYGTSLKDSVYQRFNNSLSNAGLKYTPNKTDKEFLIKETNSRIRCFGLDDPEKLKSLEDAKYIWFEEATENTEKDFDTIDAGLSPQGVVPKIILTFNPIALIPGQMHWIQERWLTNEHELSKPLVVGDAVILRTWYKDNAFCPEATVKLLEGYKKTNPGLYKMWALGEFTVLEGVIFSNWDIVENVPDGIEFFGYGLDFGFSNDPAACVGVWGNKTDLWVKGILYSLELTNEDLYQELSKTIKPTDKVIADSAEPKSIESLYRKGLRHIKGVKKRANYKEDMANELRGYNIHLIKGDIDLQKEFSTYSWARDKQGKQLPKVQDGNDHYIDAFIMLMHERKGSGVGKAVSISIY